MPNSPHSHPHKEANHDYLVIFEQQIFETLSLGSLSDQARSMLWQDCATFYLATHPSTPSTSLSTQYLPEPNATPAYQELCAQLLIEPLCGYLPRFGHTLYTQIAPQTSPAEILSAFLTIVILSFLKTPPSSQDMGKLQLLSQQALPNALCPPPQWFSDYLSSATSSSAPKAHLKILLCVALYPDITIQALQNMIYLLPEIAVPQFPVRRLPLISGAGKIEVASLLSQQCYFLNPEAMQQHLEQSIGPTNGFEQDKIRYFAKAVRYFETLGFLDLQNPILYDWIEYTWKHRASKHHHLDALLDAIENAHVPSTIAKWALIPGMLSGGVPMIYGLLSLWHKNNQFTQLHRTLSDQHALSVMRSQITTPPASLLSQTCRLCSHPGSKNQSRLFASLKTWSLFNPKPSSSSNSHDSCAVCQNPPHSA